MLGGHRGGLLLALVLVTVLGSARAAVACSCSASGPACQAFWETPLVFDAVVASVDEDAFSATLDVRHVWKGKVPARVKVPSGDSPACIYNFIAGKRYLVFGDRDPRDGRFRVSLCSATTEWDGTGRDADFLASLSRPATGGRIFGTVMHFTRWGGGVPDRDDVPIVTTVLLRTPDGVRSTTSTGGAYSFDDLAPGTYGLSVDTPAGDRSYVTSKVTIPNRRACSSEGIVFVDDGRIAGRLVNDKGRPPSGMSVEVVTAGNIPVPRDIHPRTAMVAADGSFEAGELPPGDYVVGVNLRGLPSAGTPYARVLHPGGTTPGTVTVKPGERVDLGTWQLPSPAPAWVVSGIVAWEDGRPAAGIEIRAFDVAGDSEFSVVAGRALSGADGRFEIQLWRGHRYRFVVTSDRSELMLVAAPAMELGDREPVPLRIVVRAAK